MAGDASENASSDDFGIVLVVIGEIEDQRDKVLDFPLLDELIVEPEAIKEPLLGPRQLSVVTEELSDDLHEEPVINRVVRSPKQVLLFI